MLRDSLCSRSDPNPPGTDVRQELRYFFDPISAVLPHEQEIVYNIVREKLKMIFEKDPSQSQRVDLSQLESLTQAANNSEVEREASDKRIRALERMLREQGKSVPAFDDPVADSKIVSYLEEQVDMLRGDLIREQCKDREAATQIKWLKVESDLLHDHIEGMTMERSDLQAMVDSSRKEVEELKAKNSKDEGANAKWKKLPDEQLRFKSKDEIVAILRETEISRSSTLSRCKELEIKCKALHTAQGIADSRPQSANSVADSRQVSLNPKQDPPGIAADGQSPLLHDLAAKHLHEPLPVQESACHVYEKPDEIQELLGGQSLAVVGVGGQPQQYQQKQEEALQALPESRCRNPEAAGGRLDEHQKNSPVGPRADQPSKAHVSDGHIRPENRTKAASLKRGQPQRPSRDEAKAAPDLFVGVGRPRSSAAQAARPPEPNGCANPQQQLQDEALKELPQSTGRHPGATWRRFEKLTSSRSDGDSSCHELVESLQVVNRKSTTAEHSCSWPSEPREDQLLPPKAYVSDGDVRPDRMARVGSLKRGLLKWKSNDDGKPNLGQLFVGVGPPASPSAEVRRKSAMIRLPRVNPNKGAEPHSSEAPQHADPVHPRNHNMQNPFIQGTTE
mmetsp:Transcript_74585/g.242206  ORF Transcript_74585/g.242206 Transcript_74585/m.242206 type:complete len:620 (+) Transcript_74585:173-2032(+)